MNARDKMIAALLQGYIGFDDLVKLSGRNAAAVESWLKQLKEAGHLLVSPERYHLVDNVPPEIGRDLESPEAQGFAFDPTRGRDVLEKALSTQSAEGTSSAADFLEDSGFPRALAMVALVGRK